MKRFLFLMLLPFCAVRAVEDETAPQTPRNARDLMRAVHMEPVKQAPGSRTWDEVHGLYVPWLKRVLVEPMRAKTASHAQGAAAVKFAGDVLEFAYGPGQKDPARGAEFLKQGQAIIAAGLTDPVLLWAASQAAFFVPDETTRKSLLEKAYAKLDGAGYSRALSIVVTAELCGTRYLDEERNPLLLELAAHCIAAKDEPGLFQGDDVRWYIERVYFDFDLSFENSHTDVFEKVFHAPSFPEWARETLAGKWEVCLAWKDRGGGWANTVPQKGWQGFAEHLEKARAHLVKAWALNPKEPYAAYKMISVAGGGNGGPGETLRLWFDRTIAAVYDYPDAYRQYLNFTLPRWGGSYAEMAAFGVACAETKRFDTHVPEMLFEALKRMAEDAESPDAWKNLCSDPAVGPSITFTCESYIKQAKSRQDREFWQSRLALYGWLAGDHLKAAAAIKQLQGRLAPAIARDMRKMHADTATILADSAVITAAETKTLENAISLYEKRLYAAARTAFAGVGKKAGEDALPVMRRWQELTEIEERFLRGETVTLTADADLSQWTHTFGDWKAGPGGSLVAAGWNGNGYIFHRARFGDRVEFQADVVFSDPEPKGQGLALAVAGRRFGTDRIAWNSCGITTSAGDDTVFAGIFYQFNTADPGTLLSPLENLSKVHLIVRCADKTLSFKVNDWIAFNKESARRRNKAGTPFLYPADGFIGFAYPNFLSGQTVTIRNITVKRPP